MEQHPNREKIIQDNYAMILDRIHAAAYAVGRAPKDIRLVVVTKTQPVDIIEAVIRAGAIDLGENYVEEALPKIQALSNYSGLNWHMIGHIQSRKASEVCEYFQYVHSLDSLKLAEKLSRFASQYHEVLPVWMEFNVGGEETKSGWNIAVKANWQLILRDIDQILSLPNLEYLGVMTIPPYSPDPENSRIYYKLLKEFQQFVIKNLNIEGFSGLSMGMSADFEVAIQEGSTCVRIGQAILGPRGK